MEDISKKPKNTLYKPKPHQIAKSKELSEVLRKHNLAYLVGEPRSGKTLTSILTAIELDFKRVLVLTKKNAISGWTKFIKDDDRFLVTNYEQVSKIVYEPDLVILDEAHNYGKVGKPTVRVKETRKVTYNAPLILLSGTCCVETKASLYHQFAISKYSPFNEFKNFFKFFSRYGIRTVQYFANRQILEYKTVRDDFDKVIKPYFVYMLQADAGISHKQEDVLHYIELDKETKQLYNHLLSHRVIEWRGQRIVADTEIKLRLTLHQIETGKEKFDYIKANFKGKVAVMSHFIAEQKLAKEALPDADIYSSNASAEGIDLSEYDHFIILSSDYSGAKFIQRRERNVNMNKNKPTKVHHLLVKNAVSEQVYFQVSKKRDFNNSVFNKKGLS